MFFTKSVSTCSANLKDHHQTMKWYRKAANQGYAVAQLNLGVMYYNGEGALKNFINGYVWLSLSSAKGNKKAKENLDRLSSEMTPQQIAQAQKEAAGLWEKINKSKK